ncbi:MAG: BrnT family toxin [Devosia sp.]
MCVVSRCEWDVGNLGKCQKHGVTVDEIEFVLDGDPFLYPDYDHSLNEVRTVAVGQNRVGGLVFVIFTTRMAEDRELVRAVSARYMHRKEIEKYGHIRRSQGSDPSN